MIRPETIENEVKINIDSLEYYAGDGVEWEIWRDKKTNKKYAVPIEIQRYFEDAEELKNQDY